MPQMMNRKAMMEKKIIWRVVGGFVCPSMNVMVAARCLLDNW